MLSRLSTRLTRLPSLISSVEVTQHPQAGTCLSMNLSNDGGSRTNVTVPLVWFRDHCRSPKVYNHKADLRKFKKLNLLEESRISGRNSVTFDGEQLSINWEDGHKSKFDVTLLMKMLVKPQQKQPLELYNLWSGCHTSAPPTQHLSTFSFSDFSQQFVQFGVVAIEGVDPTIEGTEKFAREMAPLHGTFYGQVWTISNSKNQEDYHLDRESSNHEVVPHTDGSSAMQTPGIVNLPAFNILTTTRIDHHFFVKGVDEQYLWAPGRPVIELTPDGGYAQIRFNHYYRSPLRLSLNGENGLSKTEDIVAFYKAYEALVIDNFRVLHARTAFKGYRQMCGVYLSRDNLMAKARLHLDEDIRFQV